VVGDGEREGEVGRAKRMVKGGEGEGNTDGWVEMKK